MKKTAPRFTLGQRGVCTLHPKEIRVIDANSGTVEYIASDESIDSYQEVIRASGWKFDRFQKNAPFVDSHNYESIDCLLGQVIDYRVEGDQLIETVKWANDVPTNFLAIKGFQMTQAGYLKAVSVGFIPTKIATPYDRDLDDWNDNLVDMDLGDQAGKIRCIYLEQQQIELSACCIGANMNAVAKAYKAGIFSDSDLETLSTMHAHRETARSAVAPADAERARQRAQDAFLMEFQTKRAKI